MMPEILLNLLADIKGNVLKKLSNALSRDSSLRKGNFKKSSSVFTMIPNHSTSRHGSQILLVPLATKLDLRRDFLTPGSSPDLSVCLQSLYPRQSHFHHR